MGQGSDSCGGYEVDYDPYEEGMEAGVWTTKDNAEIHITKMSLQHLHGARRVAYRAQMEANFTDTAEKWEQWVDMFDAEISRRSTTASKAVSATVLTPVKAPTKQRGKMVQMVCHCGQEYDAREAELKRGNGFSCGKRCAAIRRDYGRPPAKRKV